MSEAVTVPSLMMMTPIASDESLAMDTHTHTHTYTHTHTHTRTHTHTHTDRPHTDRTAVNSNDKDPPVVHVSGQAE